MMNGRIKPQTYEQWLNELKFCNEFADIIKCASQISAMSKDKKQAQIDVSLIIAQKYKTDAQRSFNPMVQRTIDADYDKIAETLFKCKIGALVRFAQKNDPKGLLDPTLREVSVRKGEKNEDKKPLGFIQGYDSVDEDGKPRPALGFVKKSTTLGKDGKARPPLGFLGGD